MADDISQDNADPAPRKSVSAPGPAVESASDPFVAAQIGDRREYPRHAVRLRVMVSDGKAIYKGRSDDLSLGGASLFIDSLLTPGMPVAVRLLTPHLKIFNHVDLNAQVQYCSLTSLEPPCRLGVKFVGVTPEAKGQLEALMR